jgi:hypothetical protein
MRRCGNHRCSAPHEPPESASEYYGEWAGGNYYLLRKARCHIGATHTRVV